MNEATISISTSSAAYEVSIGTGLMRSVGSRIDALSGGALAARRQKAFVVTNPEIWRLHGEALSAGFAVAPTALTVPAGEQHKRLTTVEALAEQMAEVGADRDSMLIAFGGGVIGDMTGFLASAYMRGVRYVQVPTTVLAQVDSAIGGKTGVNLTAGKNLFGAFHHPLAVYADIAILRTLPSSELRAGLQEAVKAGIIRNAELFRFLEERQASVLALDEDALQHVIAASVAVKAAVVAADEKESGERMLLNLGHTLGHAIEAATMYKQLLHGEAVAWGMIAAIELAEQRMLVNAEQARRMHDLICAYGPLRRFEADAATLVALTAKDKKHRSGTRSYVLPVGIGDAVVVRDVTDAELLAVAEKIAARAAQA